MLTHYTITSVGIISILFSKHFLRCSKRTKKQNSCWKTNIAEQYLTKLSPKKKKKETPDILVCFCLTKFQKDIQLIPMAGKRRISFLCHDINFISIWILKMPLKQRGLITIPPRSRQNCTQFGLRSLVYFRSFILETQAPWLLGNEGTHDTFFLHFRRVLWYSEALRLYHFYISIQ